MQLSLQPLQRVTQTRRLPMGYKFGRSCATNAPRRRDSSTMTRSYLSFLCSFILLSLQTLTESFQPSPSSSNIKVHSLLSSFTPGNDGNADCIPQILTSRKQSYDTLLRIAQSSALFAALSACPSRSIAAEQKTLTRADVGNIDLSTNEPTVTDVCWLDIQIGTSPVQRIEVSLYGGITPLTAANFKSLCLNEHGVGYKGSEIFRIISEFSVQGGNIGVPPETPTSRRNRYGQAASGVAFPPENYKILHSYNDGGVVSMMKELTNAGKQDSRFFITLKSDASWGDDRYSAFGRVTKGMNLIQALTVLQVEPPSNYPKTIVKITDSGCY